MNEQDAMFLTILRVGFAILVPIGFYHRLKSRTDEPLDRRQEGLFILVALRLVGLAGIGGLIAYLISPSSLSWSSMSVPIWLRWFGVALGVGSGLLLTWSLKTLGKNLTDTVVTRRDHTLVTNGPYRWVRHPFYVSGFLAIAANGLAGANWFFFVAGTLFFVLISIRTKKEEELLAARFGDVYMEYMRGTGRFLPTRNSERETRK